MPSALLILVMVTAIGSDPAPRRHRSGPLPVHLPPSALGVLAINGDGPGPAGHSLAALLGVIAFPFP